MNVKLDVNLKLACGGAAAGVSVKISLIVTYVQNEEMVSSQTF